MSLRTWTPSLLLMIMPPLCVVAAPSDALAQKPAVTEPSEKDIQNAQLNFKKGSDFFAMKKYKLALEAFKKSYASVASPNSHLLIARTLAALGETRDAYLEFDLVVAEAQERAKTEPKYQPTGETAALERDELTSKLALVTVKVSGDPPDAKVLIGGKEVPRERWGKPYPVMPGSTDVVLEVPSKPEVKETLTLAAGDKREVALGAVLKKPDDIAVGPGTPDGSGAGDGSAGNDTDGGSGSGKLRPFAYVAGGIGVAGFALFGVAGVMSNSTYADLEESCKGPCPPERADDVSKGKTQQTLANIGLIVGAVGVAAAVPLFILSAGKKSDEQPKTEARVLVGPGFVGVRGTF